MPQAGGCGSSTHQGALHWVAIQVCLATAAARVVPLAFPASSSRASLHLWAVHMAVMHPHLGSCPKVCGLMAGKKPYTFLLLLAAAAAAAEKGIPGFWATVLARAELVQNEKDADALTYLTGAARCSALQHSARQGRAE